MILGEIPGVRFITPLDLTLIGLEFVHDDFE
jgi:hypothetical protein